MSLSSLGYFAARFKKLMKNKNSTFTCPEFVFK